METIKSAYMSMVEKNHHNIQMTKWSKNNSFLKGEFYLQVYIINTGKSGFKKTRALLLSAQQNDVNYAYTWATHLDFVYCRKAQMLHFK